MVVSEIMKTDVATCTPQDDLVVAARVMSQRHCGFVPVVDSTGTVAGVVTDRDVCLRAADPSRPLGHIGVKEVMSHPVFSCFPEENLKVTLATMAKRHVRRLPVIDKQGHLRGVLSIDDIVQAPRRHGAPTTEEIVVSLKGISASRPIEAVRA